MKLIIRQYNTNLRLIVQDNGQNKLLISPPNEIIKLILRGGNFTVNQTGGDASVTSSEYVSLLNRVSGNSAQMTSADDAISNAVSVVSAAQAVTSAAVTSVNNRVSGVSADLTSFKQSINNFGDVSVPSPTDQQAIVWSSAAAQWVASTIAAGSGSVTSAEYLSLVNRVSSNSAQMTSADDAISNAVSVVSAAQAATSAAVTSVNQVVSVISQQVSVLSARVASNSAQMTSADDAISNAVSVVSAAQAATSAAVTSINQVVSVISQQVSVLSARVDSNSAQMTSADNAISNAVSIVSAAQAVTSAAVTSVNQVVSVLSQQVSVLSARVAGNSADFTSFKQSINNFGDVSTSSPTSAQVLRYVSVTGQWVNQTITGGSGSVTSADFVSLRSVVQANSAQMTSADNAISNAVSVVSAQVVTNSAQMTSADNAISNAVSIVSAAQAVTSAAVTSVNNRISDVSADLTSFKQSINNFGDVSISSPTSTQVLRYVSAAGQWINQTITGGSGSVTSADFVSLRSVVQANSAQMTSADNAISNAVSVVSAAQAVTSAAVTSVNDRVSAISTDVTSIRSVVSSLSTRLSALSTQVTNNSAQMTSADNAISNAVSIVSAAVVSVNNRVSTVSTLATNNSAAITSVNQAISVISQQVSVLSNKVSVFATAGINFIVDGGGSVIVSGTKGDLVIPFKCTINSWTILNDQSGDIVVDIWKTTYTSAPPTVADTITGTEKPSVATSVKNQDTDLSTWNVSINAGDVLRFKVDSASAVTRATVALRVTKTT